MLRDLYAVSVDPAAEQLAWTQPVVEVGPSSLGGGVWEFEKTLNLPQHSIIQRLNYGKRRLLVGLHGAVWILQFSQQDQSPFGTKTP